MHELIVKSGNSSFSIIFFSVIECLNIDFSLTLCIRDSLQFYIIIYILYKMPCIRINQRHTMLPLYPQPYHPSTLRYLLLSQRLNNLYRLVKTLTWVTFHHRKTYISDDLQLKWESRFSIYDHTVTIVWKVSCFVLVFFGEGIQSMNDYVAHKFVFCWVS